ncbi:MAG: RluA family pseudouridine synthase [Nitrospirae bacterium]|nr:RluA family pseudouridine synthase [Nitrospirota bacterium]
MSIIKDITVQLPESGQRLDTFISKKTGITRSQIKKLIEKNNVLVNGKIKSQNYKIKAGELISINFPEEETDELIPEPIPLEILYEDDYLVVVNKPSSMVVYPSAGHSHGTLMNALYYHCKKLATVGGPLRPGVVHRLDKDTSGVMVIALKDEAYYNLIEQFREKTINKRYIALVYRSLAKDEGEISLRIGRSLSDRKKMSTRVKDGKEAITLWKVLERFAMATLIEVRLRTGRMHQIRVHFASMGHPVLGDKTYGEKTVLDIGKGVRILFPRQMLHAEKLGLIHPATGKYVEFVAPLPEDISEKIKELRKLKG